MTIQIQFQDPPPKTYPGRAKEVMEAVEALKLRPGQWALVRRAGDKGGTPSTWRRLGCEITTRQNGDGVDVYARWPGGEVSG